MLAGSCVTSIVNDDPWARLTLSGSRAELHSAHRGTQVAAVLWIVVFSWHTLGGVAAELFLGDGANRSWLLFEAFPVLCVLACAQGIWRRQWIKGSISTQRAWWLLVVWSVAPPLVDYVLWEPVARAFYEAVGL